MSLDRFLRRHWPEALLVLGAGPLPTTTRSTEYRLERHGLPAVSIVDTPGLGDGAEQELRAQAERADLLLWVASATQPARSADRQALDDFRAWSRVRLGRRPPRVARILRAFGPADVRRS